MVLLLSQLCCCVCSPWLQVLLESDVAMAVVKTDLDSLVEQCAEDKKVCARPHPLFH